MPSPERSSPPAPPSAILETCLDVDDLDRARTFYTQLFGYQVMASDHRFAALNVRPGQVLLLFRRGSDPDGSATPFGFIPGHGSRGSIHLGFSIPAESFPDWELRLRERGIAIESDFTWPAGGRSIYFRDPDGHLLELLSPGVWPNY